MAYSLSHPNTSTLYVLERGKEHNGVWGLQAFLGYIGYLDVPPTGFFGTKTESAVKRYQTAKNLAADGVVGPKTSAIIVHSCVARNPNAKQLPRYLINGIIDAESGRLLGAVNASVSGGLDLGLTQRRCYGPPYSADAVAKALDPVFSVGYTISNADKTGILDRYGVYSARVGPGEYAWRLAALAHNWPSAAETLSRGGSLSTTREATWAPASAKFDDGVDVYSWRDWAEFYAIGSKAHNHAGLVTKLAFGVPTR